MKIANCHSCGSEIKITPSREKWKWHFCSRECYRGRFRGPRNVKPIDLVCPICGREFSRPPSTVMGRENPCCSNECRYKMRTDGRWIPHNKIDNKTLLSDLESLAQKLGRLPNTADVRDEWSGRQTLYARRFGSLRKAILKCNLNKVFPRSRLSPTTPVPFFVYCRKHDNKTVRLQGTYEVRFANILDNNSIIWLTHGEYPPLIYFDDFEKMRRYHPDFLIPSMKLYVETKGWFREQAQRKMKLCRYQNPNDKIVILFRDDLENAETNLMDVLLQKTQGD